MRLSELPGLKAVHTESTEGKAQTTENTEKIIGLLRALRMLASVPSGSSVFVILRRLVILG
jgi:hypothetical protein